MSRLGQPVAAALLLGLLGTPAAWAQPAPAPEPTPAPAAIPDAAPPAAIPAPAPEAPAAAAAPKAPCSPACDMDHGDHAAAGKPCCHRRDHLKPLAKRAVADAAAAATAGVIVLASGVVAVPALLTIMLWPKSTLNTKSWGIPSPVFGTALAAVAVVGAGVLVAPLAGMLVRWVLGGTRTWAGALGGMAIGAGAAVLAAWGSYLFIFATPRPADEARQDLTGNLSKRTPQTWALGLALAAALTVPAAALGAAAGAVLGAEMDELRVAATDKKP